MYISIYKLFINENQNLCYALDVYSSFTCHHSSKTICSLHGYYCYLFNKMISMADSIFIFQQIFVENQGTVLIDDHAPTDTIYSFKDTWYLWVKNSENMQLLDVLVCNFANKHGILVELQVKMSRGCRLLLFLPHKYQVTLTCWIPDIKVIKLISTRLTLLLKQFELVNKKSRQDL